MSTLIHRFPRPAARAASTGRPAVPLERHLDRRWRSRAVAVGAALILALLSLADHRGWFLYRGSDALRFDGKAFRVADVPDGNSLLIDAPDGRSPWTCVRLCGLLAPGNGREARTLLRHLTRDQPLLLTLPPRHTRDTAGRLLAYGRLPDGRGLNEELLAAGVTRADPRIDHPRFDRFAELERQARQSHAGAWAKRQTPAARPTTTPAPTAGDEDADD